VRNTIRAAKRAASNATDSQSLGAGLNHSWSHDTHLDFERGGRGCAAVFPLDHCTLAILCDGIGSPAVGARAASLAMRIIFTSMEDAQPDEDNLSNAIAAALSAANVSIMEEAAREPGLDGMGCSAVVAALTKDALYIAHVGDARAYLTNEDGIQLLTRDHSIVNVYVDADLLTPEDALTHPEAHVLARQLGSNEAVEVEVSERIAVDEQTAVILCNNSVHANVSDDELLATAGDEPGVASASLLRQCRVAAPDDGFGAVTLLRNKLSNKPCLSSPPPEVYRGSAQADYEPTVVTGDASDPASIFLAEALALEEDAVDMASVVMPLEQITEGLGMDMPEPTPATIVENISPIPEPITEEVPAPVTPDAADAQADSARMTREALLTENSSKAVPRTSAQPRAQEERRTPRRVQIAAGVLVLSLVGAVIAVGSPSSSPSSAFDATELGEAELTISVPEAAVPANLVADIASAPPAADAAPEMLFAPMLPPDPRRLPRRPQMYTQPPPGGYTQWNAVQAARSSDCPTALDVVQAGMQVSLDNAQLYRQAWYCFNETNQRPLARAEVATWRDFTFLVHHFEGTPEQRAQRKSSATRVGPDWYQPAAGGIEYRLEAWSTSLTTDRMAQVVDDLMGPAVVADHLAKDILLEAQAAAGLSRSDTLSEEAVQWWARRVYVAVRAMHGRAGTMIDEHRPELAPQIRALLAEATTPRSKRALIVGLDEENQVESEIWDPTGLPRAVALAHAAALGANLPELAKVETVRPAPAERRRTTATQTSARPQQPASTTASAAPSVVAQPAPVPEPTDKAPTAKVYRFDSPMIQSEQ